MFVIEVTDEYAADSGYERIACRSLGKLIERWEEETGELPVEAEENCALLATGELNRLCEVDNETRRTVTAERVEEAADMLAADGLGALVGGRS